MPVKKPYNRPIVRREIMTPETDRGTMEDYARHRQANPIPKKRLDAAKRDAQHAAALREMRKKEKPKLVREPRRGAPREIKRPFLPNGKEMPSQWIKAYRLYGGRQVFSRSFMRGIDGCRASFSLLPNGEIDPESIEVSSDKYGNLTSNFTGMGQRFINFLWTEEIAFE